LDSSFSVFGAFSLKGLDIQQEWLRSVNRSDADEARLCVEGRVGGGETNGKQFKFMSALSFESDECMLQ